MQVVAPSHWSSVKVLIAVTADVFTSVCAYVLFVSGTRLAGFTEEEKI